MQTYTLSIQDIDAYLASKRDEEVIGISQHRAKCLLAEVLKYKYKGAHAAVANGHGEIWGRGFAASAAFPLEEELVQIYHRFDELGLERPVTKREWLEACAGCS